MKAGLQNLRRLTPVAGLGPFLVGKSSPTAALYFENACADWLLDGRIKKISPTVFASQNTQLVFRHDVGVPVGFSRPNTVFFTDDYWKADRSLAWQYKQKTRIIEQRAARFFMPRAKHIGVSSESLGHLVRRAYPSAKPFLLDPYWSESLAGLTHFLHPGLEICFLGARSHAVDLWLIIPAIREVLKQVPDAYFTLSDTHNLPKDLARHPRVKWLAQSGWAQYRRTIAGLRFHIALYPVQDSAFNRCRSINKLIEHAVVGAATICSKNWQNGSERVVPVAETPQDWVETLLYYAAQKHLLFQIAQKNKALVAQENQPCNQRKIWRGLLWPK